MEWGPWYLNNAIITHGTTQLLENGFILAFQADTIAQMLKRRNPKSLHIRRIYFNEQMDKISRLTFFITQQGK